MRNIKSGKFLLLIISFISSVVGLVHVPADSIPKASYLEEMLVPGGYMIVTAFKLSEDVMVYRWISTNHASWHVVAMIEVVCNQIFFKK